MYDREESIRELILYNFHGIKKVPQIHTQNIYPRSQCKHEGKVAVVPYILMRTVPIYG